MPLTKYPKMLQRLADELDTIEQQSEWAYGFVTNIMEKHDDVVEFKMTSKQFRKLLELYEQFVVPNQARAKQR